METPTTFASTSAGSGGLNDLGWFPAVALRLLQDAASNSTATNTTNNNATSSGANEANQGNDANVLRDTFLVYGSLCLVTFFLFCAVRKLWPKPYTIRNWVESLQTTLADTEFGFLSWTWQLGKIPDGKIRKECGMDALCFIRVLRMSFKICLMGAFNAIWLLPLYATAEESNETKYIVDGIVEVTIAHVPSGSNRLVGTALAAYFLFGYVMYLILQEFEWFVKQRHKFRSQPVARNYTIYVRNVSAEYLSNQALAEFFQQGCSSPVLQAQLRVKVPLLSKQVDKRDALIVKLEHALAVQELTGKAPTHRSSFVVGTVVNSVDAYSLELKQLNKEITEQINNIMQKEITEQIDEAIQSGKFQSPEEAAEMGQQIKPASVETLSLSRPLQSASTDEGGGHDDDNVWNVRESIVGFAKTASANAVVAASLPMAAASGAVAVITGPREGEFLTAGFVTFSKLSAVYATLQMIQHETPFNMEVFEAPDPDDVLWASVGRTHKDLQLGVLFSLTATTALCLLWTIPMAFFASLSSVSALKEQVPFIAELLGVAPWVEPFFQLLAPLLVKIVNRLLPSILEFFSKLEGPISGAVLAASLFGKLSAFMIIQTFFVSAISGSVTQELYNIVNNPASVVDLLAKTLPAQSAYFIQIVFVSTVVSLSIEMLRVVPLALAAARRCFGPKLTQKERSKPFFCLRPLSDPGEFDHADMLSQVVLFITVELVYAVMAPITSFVLGFCFLYMAAAYSHQFIFIYPTKPDSGGALWTSFIGYLLICMLIAELTIFGLLGLKKSIAMFLMIPLIVITVLFKFYIQQEHFRVAKYLPARACRRADIKNGSSEHHSFKDAYLQPELQLLEAFPEMSPDQELPAVLQDDAAFHYLTPLQSEADQSANEFTTDALGEPRSLVLVDDTDTASDVSSLLLDLPYFRKSDA